jgi:pimeloyl-ACP methyl ester carboxylesterase
MSVQDLQIELPDAVPASLTLNAGLRLASDGSADTLLVLLPGGGASREYFELGEHDGFDFGFASRMAAHGFASLMIDHPGTGDNQLPGDFPFFSPRQSADILAAAIPQFIAESGIAPKRIIGIAHSMGGMVQTILQARHHLYERIVLLGSSARGLEWGLSEEEKAYIDGPDALEKDLEQLVLKRFGAFFTPGMGGPSGKSIMFGGSSEALTQRLRDVGTLLYAAGATTSMARGSFAAEAGAIDVPIFFAFGDHDIGASPEEVPQDFTSAPSIETMVLENTGHNSFAFPTIAPLCDRLAGWING